MYLDEPVFGNLLGFSGYLLLDPLRFISCPLFVTVGFSVFTAGEHLCFVNVVFQKGKS